MHPFENDPFSIVWTAFHNLWPDAECEVCWRGGLRDENGEPVWGVTTFVPDEIPEVAINPSLEVWDAVEVFAHELAHVVAGIDAEHGDAWYKAFDAIHVEYERILHEEYPDAEYRTKESCGDGEVMSYDITFKVKVEGVEKYVPVGDCDANVTWNVGEIIRRSTGLPWHNCENNGYCKDIMPCIARGLKEVSSHPEKYKPYEAKNGWGTVESVIRFFTSILEAWDSFCKWETDELVAVTTFWIE